MNIIENLKNSKKTLFIVHLAIGDFTYMQNCFLKFKEQYPNLKIDLFIQDIRMTSDESKWEHLKSYILCDWLKQTSIFHKILHAYSPQEYDRAIQELKKEKYDITITLGDLRSQNYSLLAREIAQENTAVGVKIKTSPFSSHRKTLKLLDLQLEDNQDKSIHISQKFAYWFRQMGVSIKDNELFPKINIPKEQQNFTNQLISNWDNQQSLTSIVFINIYAKGEERCWPKQSAFSLINEMQQLDQYKNSLYILNCPPEKTEELSHSIISNNLKNTHTFCAVNSFFELPALLKKCDIIITVDTSIMHLACVSNAALFSLIRKKKQTNDIRWNPLKSENNTIISTPKVSDPISKISVEKVLLVLKNTKK